MHVSCYTVDPHLSANSMAVFEKLSLFGGGGAKHYFFGRKLLPRLPDIYNPADITHVAAEHFH